MKIFDIIFKRNPRKNAALFECALGTHNYVGPSWKKDRKVKLCPCKRFGYSKSKKGYEEWFEFDGNGNLIYWMDNEGQWGRYKYNSWNRLIDWKETTKTGSWLG